MIWTRGPKKENGRRRSVQPCLVAPRHKVSETKKSGGREREKKFYVRALHQRTLLEAWRAIKGSGGGGGGSNFDIKMHCHSGRRESLKRGCKAPWRRKRTRETSGLLLVMIISERIIIRDNSCSKVFWPLMRWPFYWLTLQDRTSLKQLVGRVAKCPPREDEEDEQWATINFPWQTFSSSLSWSFVRSQEAKTSWQKYTLQIK